MTSRVEVVAYAAALDGLGVASDRERYLDLIAPGETPQRAADMAAMSGCALVAAGVLRACGVEHPSLAAPYRVGDAVARLVRIARERGALHGPERVPEPGDLVIVGGGADGGGPEHVWIALSSPEDDVIDGIDGGQRDGSGRQEIRAREHRIVDGLDQAYDDGVASRVRRRVRYVIDVEAL